MKKVLLTSAVVLTAFGAYNSVNAADYTAPSVTVNTSTYVQSLKQKIEMVKSGYPYKDANGNVPATAHPTDDAASLQSNVEQVQAAIVALTKLQNEYKVLFTKYHNALTERQEREAKQDELAKAVGTAKAKVDDLLYDQQGSKIANSALTTEYNNLTADVTNNQSIAFAYQDLTTKKEVLSNKKDDLAKYKAENVTELASNYQAEVTRLTGEVNTAQLAVDEAEKEYAKRSARAESLETDIILASDVDYATGYAIRQATRELRAANKAQAENDGKLAAVIKLVNEPTTGLQARLTTLKGTGAGSIKEAEGDLGTKIGLANTAFATVEANIAAVNPAQAKRVGLKFEFEKLADAVKAVLATETPDVPATPAPAKAAWVQSGSSWWYKHADGSYTTNGWEKINGTWYHFDQAGWMQTGWVKDGNTWYYLKDSGAMATGWVKDNGTWYYLKDNGAMATGWYKVGEKWYYSYASGALAVNTTVNGYTVNENGEWVK
ncbi:hypothetical protein [Streptococcus mitis]|uniref:hypothetical protein n=1 Tax=Streptococcus mitis TaxID=28037 RepID=UPI00398C1F10